MKESREAAGMPRADDLAGWKAVDRRVMERFDNMLDEAMRVFGPKPVRRYFRDEDLRYYFEEHQQRGVIGAYLTWALLDYRESKTKKTYAERMLEEGLGEAEAAVLRAIMESTPSIYRVAEHDAKAGTVTLEDVLLGGETTVRDRLLSENIRDGVFITGRVYPVGAFRFLTIVGPPLGAGMIAGAIDFLEREGVELTRESLRANAHKLGWLWKWSDEWEARRPIPELRNTDDDKMVLHTARFSVDDEEATRKRIAKHRGVLYDDYGDEYVWTKKTGPGVKMLQGPVNLAHLKFKDGDLEVEVNSVERFEKIRGWLEKMPGVALKKVDLSRPEEEMARKIASGEAEEDQEDVPPEVAAQMQEKLNEYYMNWLDDKLPMFGGKTPRQMCRTEEGRRRVEMEIRTMPEPSSVPGVKAPRDAMRRELGLPAAGREVVDMPDVDAGEEDGLLAPVREKVGRNEPCPCGSGKKYKKCCGAPGGAEREGQRGA